MIEEATISVTVQYDSDHTRLDKLVEGLNFIMENALSTQGILDEHGNPTVSDFFIPSDEDEIEALAAMSDAIDIARRELGRLKEVLEANS